MANDFYVYGYKDWKGKMRYIGKGRGNRFRDHISLATAHNEGRRLERKSPFSIWLAKQIRDNKPYTVEKIAEGLSEEEALLLEIATIKAIGRLKREPGGTLLNRLEGGDGVSSADARAFQSEPGYKEKKAAGAAKVRSSPEFRQRLSAATKVANGTERRRKESKEKITKQWEDEEFRAAAKRRAKELWADPEWSAARREELRKRNQLGKGKPAPQIKKLWESEDFRKAVTERMKAFNQARRAKKEAANAAG